MAGTLQTYLFCFDDHKSFSEDVKKRFSDISKYIVTVSHNREEFIRCLGANRDISSCKVAIIGLHESKENFEMADHLIQDIKEIDRSTGIILLAPPDRIEELKKTARQNVDSYIPKNSNTVLRIHNTVKKLISEHSLGIYRKKRSLSLYILLVFVLVAILFAVIARYKLPLYF